MIDSNSAMVPQQTVADSRPLAEKVRSLQLPAGGGPLNSAAGDNAKKALILILGLACFIFAGSSFGWFRWSSDTAQKPAAKETAASDTQAEKTTSEKSAESLKNTSATSSPAGDIALESNGYFVPARKILVSPKVSGMLIESNIQEGRYFKKGEVLGVIESIDYQADVRRAVAARLLAQERLRELEKGNRVEEIDQVEAELAETEAMMRKDEADYKRATELIQRKSITRAEYDETVANYFARQRRVERLKAAVKLMKLGAREERVSQSRAELQQVEAELAKSEWRLENCQIRAPVSGTILAKNAEEGNIVNPIAMNGSFSLCEMADLSDLEVDLKIQERDIARVFVGQKCRVRAIAYPDRNYDGVVDRLMPIADRSKGAVPIRVKVTVPVEEQGQYLKPEMGAIVTFFARKPEKKSVTLAE